MWIVVYDRDNGIGFPEDLDFKNTDALDLQLVNNLVDQIDGEITLDTGQGTKFKIIFKELVYKKRI
jgi:two-component sensor histidine kinase